MRFDLLRLSVLPRPQVDGFERTKPDKTPFTREEWLREVFSARIEFQHHREAFHYAPYLGASAAKAEDVGPITGRIGRQVKSVENAPPEADLSDVERDIWRAAIVLIDPTHHDDGQKAGVERLPQIGRPVPIFLSLVDAINAHAEPYLIEANPIVPSETFWTFVKEHEGEITSVEFEFIAPNMFGGEEDFTKEMRDMQEKEKAQKAKLVIESKDGLNLNTDRVRNAANQITRGAGSIKARTKTKKVYNSKSKAKSVTIPKDESADASKESLISLAKRLIFGG